MAITDLQISDTLETSAPSIKYTGNEGPQAPQQMASYGYDEAMAESRQAYEQGLKDGTVPIDMKFEEFLELMQDSKRAPQQDPGIMQAAQGGRIGYAGGGIMGSNNGSMLAARTADGSRPKYGLLDKIKSRVRKLIPNEIAGIAEKAAPFVAPFNPLAAGLMSGIGGFDRHGSLGKGLKSGLMNYGLGQGARYLGGADFQGGINPLGGFTEGTTGTGALSKYFSKPTGSGGIKNLFKSNVDSVTSGNTIGKNSSDVFESIDDSYTTGKEFDIGKIAKDTKNVSGILKTIDKFAIPILLGSMGIAAATAKPQDMEAAINATRGTGLDIAGIRKEVQEALAGGEEAWAILQQKYPYVGEFPTKKAEGGRIGLYAGGVPSPYSMEDARKTSMQDKMGGITDVMKRADLSRQGDVGQMYAAEGGLMDLGGMEKDYRNDGGFVPIGGKEKADDVPARLSKNEFVFTADAVRGAGGGDIDKGAEIMENIMTNLEQGGQMSEESQGLGGAQEMFDVSERLGEVI